jgi:hypothetical protein
MKRLLLALLLIGASFPAYAQSPVLTQPYNVTSVNYSSTIVATNTFQSIWVANTTSRGRAGCTVQNNGTHVMYVYFGAIASATTPNAVNLSAGQSVRCNNSGITLQDQVSITGTLGDRFYASQQ